MKVIFHKLPNPPVEEWGPDGRPFFMLYQVEKKEKGTPNELIALCGAFPVFETKAEAELLIEAIAPEHPNVDLVPVQVLWKIAAAAELAFGKPVQLVRVTKLEEGRKL